MNNKRELIEMLRQKKFEAQQVLSEAFKEIPIVAKWLTNFAPLELDISTRCDNQELAEKFAAEAVEQARKLLKAVGEIHTQLPMVEDLKSQLAKAEADVGGDI